MLEKVEQVARRVVADISDESAYVLACDWVNERYREYVRKCRPRHLRKVGLLNLPAYITGGSVTIARGESVVVGDSTAVALWSRELIGWHFRCHTVWYKILEVDLAAGTLELEAQMSEEDVVSGGYMIVKRFHTLPDYVKTIGQMYHPRRRIPIENVHPDMLDRLYTERLAVGTLIQFWADQGNDEETGARLIEVYPPVKELEAVGITYWLDPERLEYDSIIPRFMDGYVLKEGALINAYRYKMSQAANAGHADVAQFWSNEKARQETLWLAKMRSMAKGERGADDLSIILQVLKTRSGYGQGGDIATAREQVYANWVPLT